MPAKHPSPPRTQRRFRTVWGELDYVCKRIHYWLYRRRTPAIARRYLGRLERLIHELPDNDLAILREEALALRDELKGHRPGAVKHRRRELDLTERLHKSVHQSVAAGSYDEGMAASILAGRDGAALEERRAILADLLDEHPGRNRVNSSKT
jgi:hypothetical protein